MIASLQAIHAQDGADPASRAFEEGRWQDVIAENRRILEGYPEDRTAYLRIAQAERELGRYEAALETLTRAAVAQAPPAMIDLERARNLLLLGRRDEALVALLDSDHNALRAYRLLEEHGGAFAAYPRGAARFHIDHAERSWDDRRVVAAGRAAGRALRRAPAYSAVELAGRVRRRIADGGQG